MPRALVIDDEPYVRATITLTLKANGFGVVSVESARQGLRELEKTLINGPGFDLAIVDIYMPGMDGVKLIKALRQLTPNLPIIAISGAIFRSSGRTVFDVFPMAPDLAGVTCLRKPFRPNELLDAVQSAVGVATAQ